MYPENVSRILVIERMLVCYCICGCIIGTDKWFECEMNDIHKTKNLTPTLLGSKVQSIIKYICKHKASDTNSDKPKCSFIKKQEMGESLAG